MKSIHILISASLAIAMLCGCSQNNKNKVVMKTYEKGTFGYDLHYLSDKDSIVILSSDDSLSQVIVSPKLQGKVFTSTASGAEGRSLGFLNYKVFESEENNKHMPHPIPYVQQHIEAMGRKAADLLIEQMTSQSKMPQTCKFPATLMITPDSNS